MTNMTKTTRVMAILLALVMLMQTFAFAVQTSIFGDFPTNSWSTNAMTAAVENGILIGMGNNRIEPKRNLKRAEMAATITRAFGASVEKDTSFFEDVKQSDWYSSVISKAYNMQVMQGTSDKSFAPKNSISREEVFLTLARVLFIDSENFNILDKFSDKADIADWSKNAVTGMVEEKYLNGYENGMLIPKGKITREELAQVFYNIFKTYISKEGVYDSVAPEGSVIIRAPGVTLENVTINGDLILADGIGKGDCTLKNVKVNGRIIVRGGEGTVDFINVTATGKVIVNDVNGTVNFHNYRTDAPFKDNLIENTPATFLKPSGGGGGGGGGVSYGPWNVSFNGYNAEKEPVEVKKYTGIPHNKSLKEMNKVLPTEAEALGGYAADHSLYGWMIKSSSSDLYPARNVKTSKAVEDAKVTSNVTYDTIMMDAGGNLSGGGFDAAAKRGEHYFVNPKHTDGAQAKVDKDELLEELSTKEQYPTSFGIMVDGITTDSDLTLDELVQKLESLEVPTLTHGIV